MKKLWLIVFILTISQAYCNLVRYDALQNEATSASGQVYPDMPEPAPYSPSTDTRETEEAPTTEAALPESTTGTTTTTTTTPSTPSTTRSPLAFEKYTSGLIRNSNDTMDQLQMDLLRYETQLNLNALDTLLPVLEEIRDNMTDLLSSSHPDHQTFQEESLALDSELTGIEDQIKKNRELQEHYETIRQSTKEQLGMVYGSLSNLLNSQVYILGFKQNSKSLKPKSDSEIRLFIDHTLTFTATKSSATEAYSEIKEYLKELQDPSNRLVGYSYFLSKSNSSFDAITLEFVREVFAYPELSSLRGLVPSVFGLIFSDEPKGMKSLYTEKQLTVGTGSTLAMSNSSGEEVKRWKFHPQEGSPEYFAIVDGTTNQALGLVSTRRTYYSDELKSLGLLRYDETTQLNQRYHWQIVPNPSLDRHSGKTSLIFVNRELPGYAIGVETGTPSVSSYASYYASRYQQWGLF